MDTLLLVLALSLQMADAAQTCHLLKQGAREFNPVLGQSCAQVVGVKTAMLALVPLWPAGRGRRAYLTGLAIGGGVGVGVTLALRK